MNTYKRHRFPPDVISYAVWLYYRFNLSHRRCAGPFIEDLLAERGITVTRESIRLWCFKFGPIYSRRLKRKHRGYGEPRKIVTDKLRSYAVAQREVMPDTIQRTQQYENNRAEQSHESTRARERGMRWSDISEFKSVKKAKRFLGAHAAVSNLFNLGRHLISAEHHRILRAAAFADWGMAVA
jgi:putative transposase